MSISSIIQKTKLALTSKPIYLGSKSAIEQQIHTQRAVNFALVTSLAMLMLMLMPTIADAATGTVTGGAMTSFEDGVQKLIDFLTGTIAKSVAILAVVMLGFMAMVGKLSIETAGKVILGIVLIFSAAQIVGLLVT